MCHTAPALRAPLALGFTCSKNWGSHQTLETDFPLLWGYLKGAFPLYFQHANTTEPFQLPGDSPEHQELSHTREKPRRSQIAFCGHDCHNPKSAQLLTSCSWGRHELCVPQPASQGPSQQMEAAIFQSIGKKKKKKRSSQERQRHYWCFYYCLELVTVEKNK